MCKMQKFRTRISFFWLFSAKASSADMLAGGGVCMILLVRSTFFRTSLATMSDPMFACLAKKIMTLSLATLIRILALLAFVIVREMN